MHPTPSTVPPSTNAELSRASKLSTDEFAAALRLKPQTIRAGLCRNGHYMGVVPCKLPNGRLLWDAGAAARLTGGDKAPQSSAGAA